MSDITALNRQTRDLFYSLILLKKYCETLQDSEEFEIIKFAVSNATKLADKMCYDLNSEE